MGLHLWWRMILTGIQMPSLVLSAMFHTVTVEVLINTQNVGLRTQFLIDFAFIRTLASSPLYLLLLGPYFVLGLC